ncbi:hypothetical protein KA977_08620, partial [Candidatus Dependentiae bacterium]|nr:hypothetical protein [Candidatus Dependentiae bacterium]
MYKYINKLLFFLVLILLSGLISNFILIRLNAQNININEEIYNLAVQLIAVLDKKTSYIPESDKKKLAEFLLEQSEYLLIKMQVSISPDDNDKQNYISVLKKAEQIYNFIDYQPGIFLCKSRLLKFEIAGLEQITELSAIKKKLIDKLTGYLNELPESEQKNINSSAAKPQDFSSEKKIIISSDTKPSEQVIISEPISKIISDTTDVSINSDTYFITKNYEDTSSAVSIQKNIFHQNSDNTIDTGSMQANKPEFNQIINISNETVQVANLPKPQPFYQQAALLEPKLSYSNDVKISPVLRHILFTEKLEKDFDEIRSQRLFDLTDIRYGNTKLSISGQKTINFSYTNRKYAKTTDSTNSSSDFKIDQTLEVKVRGKVGDNVEVNIDYDDQRSSSNRQQLSIEYKSDEHVLNKRSNSNIISGYAAFGDIVLSLPSTEFVSYRRSLFGIKGGLKIRNLNYSILQADQITFDIIASRTKGEPGHKEFIGNNSTQIINSVYDVNFVKNKYFKITTGIGTDTNIDVTSISVYIDDKSPTNDQGNIDTFAVEVDPADPSKISYVTTMSETGPIFKTFSFTPLTAVKDFTFDKNKGILTLNSYITDNYAIAVSYTTNNGYSMPYKKLVKKDKDSQNNDTYVIYSIKNRYSFGVSNINKNDPDFIFKIQDKNNNFISDTVAGFDTIPFLRIFGLDKTGPGSDGLYGTADDAPDGKIDDEFIDYEDGWIEFPVAQPFNSQSAALYGLANSLIYIEDNPTSRFRFY